MLSGPTGATARYVEVTLQDLDMGKRVRQVLHWFFGLAFLATVINALAALIRHSLGLPAELELDRRVISAIIEAVGFYLTRRRQAQI